CWPSPSRPGRTWWWCPWTTTSCWPRVRTPKRPGSRSSGPTCTRSSRQRREPDVFTHTHRVRNHEVDTQGFLFNSRYLELADVAMTEFFRELGWPYAKLVEGGTDPSVVSARQTFQSPARFDDVLDVDVA